MALSIFLNLLLATAVTARLPMGASPDHIAPVSGVINCPPGALCHLPHNQKRAITKTVTVIDEDCAEKHTPTPLAIVTNTICPSEGCHDTITTTPSAPGPVATLLTSNPPENHVPPPVEFAVSEKPVVTPAPTPTAAAPMPLGTAPTSHGSIVVTRPRPAPESIETTRPMPPTTSPLPPPVAGAERGRSRPAPGVYLGMAGIFVAVNWF